MDVKKLRETAGCFATGVTVIAVKNNKGAIHGMTASSFLSVSLDPPLVMFSVMKENQLSQLLELGMPLGISVLTENMMGESNHFAKIKELDSPPSFVMKSEAPVLKNHHAWFATRVKQLIPAGDHDLVLCEVIDLGANKEENPLIYYQGYQKLSLG